MSSERPDLPGLVNGPVLMLSGLLAAPAYLRLAQGMLTVTEVLTRYLLITAGCIAVWGVVRMMLPALLARPDPDEQNAIPGVVVGEAPTRVMSAVAEPAPASPSGTPAGANPAVAAPANPAAALAVDASAGDRLELSGGTGVS